MWDKDTAELGHVATVCSALGVLQEGEDVLVNVNMVDKERADKNVELRKKKPDYLPYAEDESVDDLAQVCLWGNSWGRWCVLRSRVLWLLTSWPRSQPLSCLTAKTPLHPGQI